MSTRLRAGFPLQLTSLLLSSRSRRGAFNSFAVAALLAVGAGCGDSDPRRDADNLDRDGDGWPRPLDCNDNDKTVFPNADETADDGIDQDCSGSDAGMGMGGGGSDGNGGGSGNSGGALGGAGGVSSDDVDGDGWKADKDCDDGNPTVHPGRLEIVLDGIDQNCDDSDLPAFDVITDVLEPAALPAAAPELSSGIGSSGKPVLLAVWADSRVAPRQDLYAQLLDADGTPLGDEISVDTVDNAAKWDVRIASKGDGFLVSWATSAGIRVRLLDADGAPSSITLGYGDAGGAAPAPAFGGGYWAVAWTIPGEQKAAMRSMDVLGVRSNDIFEFTGAAPSNLSLLGTSDGFVAAWDGPQTSGYGISSQTRSGLSAPNGEPVTVASNAGLPVLAPNTNGSLAIAYRVLGGLGYIEGGSLSNVGALSGQQRISSESSAQTRLRMVKVGDSHFVAWEDSRHLGGALSANAVYGNFWSGSATSWSGSAGLHAGSISSLGGMTNIGSTVWISLLTEQGPGLLRLEKP